MTTQEQLIDTLQDALAKWQQQQYKFRMFSPTQTALTSYDLKEILDIAREDLSNA